MKFCVNAKLPKAGRKLRAGAIIIMACLLTCHVVTMWVDFPFNGNPFIWLNARDKYIEGTNQRTRYRLAAARDKFEAALKIYPRDAQFQFALGETLERLEKYSLAENCFREAVRLKPKHIDAWLHLSAVQLAQEHKAAALASVRQALKIKPEEGEAECQLALMLFSASPKESEEIVSRVLESKQEKTARCWMLAGQCFDLQNKPDLAKSSYLHAARMDRSNPEFAEVLAIWLANHHQPDQAVFWFKHASTVGSCTPGYLENYGMALMMVGNLDLAVLPLRKALELSPADLTFRSNYASLLFGRREYAAALALLQPQVENNTADEALWNIYVNSLVKEKTIGESKERLQQLVDKCPGQGKAIASLYIAEICLLQGLDSASKQGYERALSLNPDAQLKSQIEQRLQALQTRQNNNKPLMVAAAGPSMEIGSETKTQSLQCKSCSAGLKSAAIGRLANKKQGPDGSGS